MKISLLALLIFLSSVAVNAAKPLSEIVVVPETERKIAPTFVAEGYRGSNHGLADYKGKAVLLHFFATWCIPCRGEMVELEALRDKYTDHNFDVIAVANGSDSKDDIEDFIQSLTLNFPILIDESGDVNYQYKVTSVPTSYLLDRNEKLVSRINGAKEWMSPESIKLVENVILR